MISNEGNQIGQILVNEGKLDPDDLDLAIREHKKTGDRLGQVLIKMGLLNEEDVLKALSKQLGIPFIRLGDIEIDPAIIARIPAKLVTHYNLVPLEENNGLMRIALNDPLDIHMLDDLRLTLKAEIEPVICTSRDIVEAIRKYYGIGADTVEGMIEDKGTGVDEVQIAKSEDIEEMAEDASIVRFVNQIIAEAIRDRSTDIHFEPFEDELRIRYRIDGILYEAQIPAQIKRFQSAILSRIKIMSEMNIAERRLPQDGKIRIVMGEEDFDLRVSTVPTPYGESISVRILNRSSSFISLKNLGFEQEHLDILHKIIQKPHGIILVTGPTGSGKSTTLYAALSEINQVDKKIITIEDPIEYRLRGVTQIQVNTQIGLNFASILRNILRQDPDILMVGEIRDQETAEIAIRTALTGHLVFSTLHTNDATSAVTRLLDMGIEPFLVSSTVEGMLAQRLVRVLCIECKAIYTPDEMLLNRVNLEKDDISGIDFYRNVGCDTCRYTGFVGRTAVYEIVQLNEALRRLIVARTPANIIKQQAIKDGLRPLRQSGWKKVKAGITTIDEVLRVSMEDEMAYMNA